MKVVTSQINYLQNSKILHKFVKMMQKKKNNNLSNYKFNNNNNNNKY